jgi:hypothetical protein
MNMPSLREIRLPDEDTPQSLEDQLRAALYEGANYHEITKITHTHRASYLVPEHIYEKLVAASTPEAAQ